ncbi:hypothetical protein FA13DRAFT_1773216 [Coprinellus micaceus]|uniref:Uncharacterized protein n=1 Tax=Coprinellus micaceus TaxID=71717 RepID=A0A4Y7THC7_COPMI|nr:hypothetical protein FA13DRAFT_1773216 [Coprinellus micaceus]
MLFASPELRRTPSSSASPHPAIEPLLFHSLPPPPASPPRVSAIVDVRHGEPLPPLPTHRHVTPDDPFALPIPAPVASQPQLVQVELNGRLLQLTQGIAGRLAAPPPINPPAALPDPIRFRHLGTHLQAMIAQLPPPPPLPNCRRRVAAAPPFPPASGTQSGGTVTMRRPPALPLCAHQTGAIPPPVPLPVQPFIPYVPPVVAPPPAILGEGLPAQFNQAAQEGEDLREWEQEINEPVYPPGDVYLPIDENAERCKPIRLGRMTLQCRFCHAYHWAAEKLT